MFVPQIPRSTAQPIIIIAAIIAWIGLMNPSMSSAQGTSAPAGSAQALKQIPKDVDPNSGFRLPLMKRDDMDEYGKKVFDKVIGGGRTLVGQRGPSGIRLHSPKVAELEYEISQYLRYHSGLSGSIRELAILITAREMNSPFEWAAHEPQGLKDGLPQAIVDVVKYRKSVEGLPETEAIVIQLGRQIFGKKKVDSDTYAQALKIFGPKHLVDLVTLMGYYASTAALLTAFDMQLDDKQKQYVLPMP